MKNLEENLVKIVDSIETIIKTQRSVQDFMQGQLEANEFLAKRIKQLEGRVAMAENDRNVMTAISNLIPVTEIDDEIPITAEQYTMQKEVADVDTKRD